MSYTEDVVQKVTMNERRLDNLILPEITPDMISCFMALPMLRGFWPMSPVDSAGDCYDQSGHAHHLGYNGNPTYNYTNLVPYIDLDGTGDYLDRADEADLDILGTEAYVTAAIRGITFGGWFNSDDTAVAVQLIGKGAGAVATASYGLQQTAAAALKILIGDGAATETTSSTNTMTQGSWDFCVGRWDPSTTRAVYLSGTWTSQASAIANLQNTGIAFQIGAYNGATAEFDGQATLCFLCAAYLSDEIIDNLYQQTRGLFGV